MSAKIEAKRTFRGWARDVAGNLLVNLVSIFVLGALLLGYRFSGELQRVAEGKAELGVTTPHSGPSDLTPLPADQKPVSP